MRYCVVRSSGVLYFDTFDEMVNYISTIKGAFTVIASIEKH